MKNTQITKNCILCGSPFKVKAYRSETAHYCSKDCWSKRRKPFYKICRTCGNQFDAVDHRNSFCSDKCVLEWRTGETSPVWKGGKSLVRKRAQAKGDLAKWRNAVYQRDNYTCQDCGKSGVEIHAHHIKPFADNLDLALDVSNGITLCVGCHEKIHGRKLVSPAKFQRHCADCGCKTTGRSDCCRSCSIKRSWSKDGHLRSINSGKIPVIT